MGVICLNVLVPRLRTCHAQFPQKTPKCLQKPVDLSLAFTPHQRSSFSCQSLLWEFTLGKSQRVIGHGMLSLNLYMYNKTTTPNAQGTTKMWEWKDFESDT